MSSSGRLEIISNIESGGATETTAAKAAAISPSENTSQKSIEDFPIGSQVRRLFDDGVWYIARVMTEPKYVYDAEKQKTVLSRMVKYYVDDQEEWADEEQLNDWAYDMNGATIPEGDDGTENKKQQDKNCDDNWLNDDNSEKECDDDSFVFRKGDVDKDDSTLRGKKDETTQHESAGASFTVDAIVTPPPSEIAPRSFPHTRKNANPANYYSEPPIPPDITQSSDCNHSAAEDTVSEITGSSPGINNTNNSTVDENDGRRRSKRTKKQTNAYLASPSSQSRKIPPVDADADADADAGADSDAAAGPGRKKKSRLQPGKVSKTREEARQVLIFKMGITEEEIDYALNLMSPPYSQNEAVHKIHKRRQEARDLLDGDGEESTFSQKFNPEIGMRVRVPEGGSNWHGTITSGPEYMFPAEAGTPEKVKMWTVTLDDGEDEEHYDWFQLLRFRASRPIIKNCRGRPLNAIELFCGEGIVTQSFCERKFNVKSIDLNPESYALMTLDICKARYEDIGFVPDFIWASPPCTTCTYLAGGKHRKVDAGEFENTQLAHDHNTLFAQMMYIMRWAKSKNPHLIVVIENPQAQMQKLPIMIEFMKTFGLHKATVDYCAFGRSDKKPTNLWTNDFNLYGRLNEFRCLKGKCPYWNQKHPIGTKTHGQLYNAAAIPGNLAEEVADYVSSKFYMDRIAYTPEVTLTIEEENEFDRCMSAGT